MAEDQGEAGLEATAAAAGQPAVENCAGGPTTKNVSADEPPAAEEKTDLNADQVRGTGDPEKPVPTQEEPPVAADATKDLVEDDEESQSLKLELEDVEDVDEAKSDGKDKNAKDSKAGNKEAKDKDAESVDKTKKLEKPEKEKIEESEPKIERETSKEAKVEAPKIPKEKEEVKKSIGSADGSTEKGDEELPAEKVTTVEESKEQKAEDNEAKDKKSAEDKKAEGTTSEAKSEAEAAPEKVEETPKEKPKPVTSRREEEEEEVGIVGPPTVASELLSEEELASEKPSLPTVEKKPAVSDRVVRWVENTAIKADDPATHCYEDEDERQAEEIRALDEPEVASKPRTRGRKRKQTNGTNGSEGPLPPPPATRKSQRVVTSIIRRSIRCLNKMHAMESSATGGNGKKAGDSAEELQKQRDEDEESRKSPKVPQSQQNGAALPEETASADRNLLRCSALAAAGAAAPAKRDKRDALAEAQSNQSQSLLSKSSSKLQSEQTTPAATAAGAALTSAPGRPGRPSGQRSAAAKLQQLQEEQQQQQQQQQLQPPPVRETRKRRSAETSGSGSAGDSLGLSSNGAGAASPKKLCLDQREQFINSLIGSEKFNAEQLAARAEQLRAEVQDLDELARAKEMEWNEILSMRKLKEEAYLRIERRRQVMGFMECNGPLGAELQMPPASLALGQQQNYDSGSGKERGLLLVPKEERADSVPRDSSPVVKRERAAKAQPGSYQYQPQASCRQQPAQGSIGSENGPRQQQQQLPDAQSPEHRQIGEGRQGPIVDVRSIIADYRLRHPETVPRRRGRRLRNSVNIGLGAGGAMVETIGTIDSRPSSTDSCKSNSNVNDPNTAMSYKDVLVQFAKLSQQQGEPIKTPHNYPDVTLHPVTTTPATQNATPQGSGSLLHGILTKSQSPRPTTFSPTLARLLTAPERERSSPTITPAAHQTTTQHLLQAYQGANSVSISDFLSSSKARTEITITPVVNNPIQTHSNNLIHVDDVEEETSVIEERDSRLSIGSKDNREDRDSPPRCQGCHERAAQFVCAGCGNQWYCSRECQVAAWDEHSEVCSG